MHWTARFGSKRAELFKIRHFAQFLLQIFVQNYYLTFPKTCGTIITERKRGNQVMMYAMLFMFLVELILIIKGMYDILHNIDSIPIGFLEFIGGMASFLITIQLFIER